MSTQIAQVADTQTTSNSLERFSLRGMSAELERNAVEQKMIVGSFCLAGQGTVIFAPPNSGKTLIALALLLEAIAKGRIDGDNVIYVNADDTTQGIAEKVRLLDDYRVHMVAEGYQGFRARMLAPILEDMVDDGSARGKIVILDTVKKFTQPMNKEEVARFTAVVRRFLLAGGTVLALAHTNKYKDARGQNVYAGVSDLRDDLDCAYIINLHDGEGGERVAVFTNLKRRGNVPDTVTYAYSGAPELSYIERLTTVRETEEPDQQAASDTATPDNELLESIALAIHHGPLRGKMEIVRMISQFDDVPKQRVLRLLEQHTGEDPASHRWRYAVRAHGKFTYELLGAAPGEVG